MERRSNPFFNILKTILLFFSFIFSWILIIFMVFGSELINITLIGDEELNLNIKYDYFENGYIANLGPINLNGLVKTKSNINNKELGTYEVVYYIDYLLGKKEVIRKVNVIDGIAPVIELNGEVNIVLNKYYNYEEPGYTAIDNLDGDLTNKVTVVSNIDTSTLGTYKVKYSISDNAGNETVVERSVEVVENNILSSPVSTFRLNGLFGNVMLEKSETEYNYMDDAVIIGDSNIRYLYLKGKYLEGNQVWGKNNLNAGDISTAKIIIHDTNEQLKVVDAIKKYQPKYAIASFGITSASFLTKDVFIQKVEEFFELIKEECPETKLVVASMLPVTTYHVGLQNPINKYNYYLLELCDKHNIAFINISDALKADSGYGAEEYFYCASEEDCGFHLSNKGKEFYVNYLKSVDLSKEIK